MLRRFVILILVALASAIAAIPAYAVDCRPTPRQTEGPYYPPASQREGQKDTDHDLTRVDEQSRTATGQSLLITGIVKDEQCRPIQGAVVEIWQASENGRYRHPRDRDNPAPLDPGFQYWGRSITDGEGRYTFKTIKPGSYQAAPRWIRPPHVHFKVTHPDFRPLVTQMYFAGDAHQEGDYILNEVPPSARDRVIVELQERRGPSGDPVKAARFDLVLGR